VIYFDAVRRPPEVEDTLAVEYRPLDELFAEADVVSLHVPLNRATRGLVGRRAFA